MYLVYSQAYDQHLNMILGDVEETVTTIELDEETFEEIFKVCSIYRLTAWYVRWCSVMYNKIHGRADDIECYFCTLIIMYANVSTLYYWIQILIRTIKYPRLSILNAN